MQSRTALADTAGSAFNQDCREFLENSQFDAVLDKIFEQFPLLYTKASASKASDHISLYDVQTPLLRISKRKNKAQPIRIMPKKEIFKLGPFLAKCALA